jgi:hypothetical protein
VEPRIHPTAARSRTSSATRARFSQGDTCAHRTSLLEEVVEDIIHTVQNAPCSAAELRDIFIEEIPNTLQGLAIHNGEKNLVSGLEPEISALASISEVTPTECGQPQVEPRNESFSLTAAHGSSFSDKGTAYNSTHRKLHIPECSPTTT